MREQDSERETRLGGIRPLAHDHDERPSREDKQYGGSIFDIPVPLPRFLRPRRRRAAPKPEADVAERDAGQREGEERR